MFSVLLQIVFGFAILIIIIITIFSESSVTLSHRMTVLVLVPGKSDPEKAGKGQRACWDCRGTGEDRGSYPGADYENGGLIYCLNIPDNYGDEKIQIVDGRLHR